jgi:RNA polymerase sigma factor (sigma-70 family)
MDAHALYETHCEAVNRLARRVARANGLSRQDCEDFSQDVWLYLLGQDLRLLKAFRGQSSLETYLWTFMKRRCAVWNARRLAAFNPRLHQPFSIGLAQRERRPDVHRQGQRLSEALDRVIERLPVSDRELLRLHFIQGMSVTEIVVGQKASRWAMYKRLERLLQGIRRSLGAAGFTAADVSAILESSQFGWSGATLQTPNPEPRGPSPEPATQNPEPRTPRTPRRSVTVSGSLWIANRDRGVKGRHT